MVAGKYIGGFDTSLRRRASSSGCLMLYRTLLVVLVVILCSSPVSISFCQTPKRPTCEMPLETPFQGQPDGYINVIASLNLTKGTAVVKYITHTQAPSQPKPVPHGLVVVQVHDKAGCPLETFGATWLKDSDKATHDESTGIAVVSFPYLSKMASLRLVSANKVLSTWRLEPDLEGVTGLVVKSTSRLTEQDRSLIQSAGHTLSDKSVLAEWTSHSVGNSGQDYTVQLSLDGKTWSTLAVALNTTHYQLDADQFGLNSGDRAYLRVSSNNSKGDNASMTVPFVIQ